MSRSKSLARQAAVQALYQWQMAGGQAPRIAEQFTEQHYLDKAHKNYFMALLNGVIEHHATLDQAISPFISRPLAQIDPVERAILRLATYELRFHPELPYRVVINESVTLARTFGAEGSHKFINGILDKVAKNPPLDHDVTN
ncbi:MAG: transcription antitermination factor NusB [Methylococcales bacterium]|nr:transcription antitermination factor NusB [Methylococcales bacterium]